ncbi:hypothetical protein SLA2020_042180 [Shorea laevis]
MWISILSQQPLTSLLVYTCCFLEDDEYMPMDGYCGEEDVQLRKVRRSPHLLAWAAVALPAAFIFRIQSVLIAHV